jgi:hypothetical protein
MAEAIVTKKTVKEQVMTTVEKEVIDGVTIHLTPEEAVVLRAITGNIIGGSSSSNRGITDSIYYALGNAGVSYAASSKILGEGYENFNLGNSKKISRNEALKLIGG